MLGIATLKLGNDKINLVFTHSDTVKFCDDMLTFQHTSQVSPAPSEGNSKAKAGIELQSTI